MADARETTTADGTLGPPEGVEIPWMPERARRLRLAFAVAWGLLAVLGWLLAKLVWLPFYFGVFFFLVAGLLVGAAAFRICSPVRPIPRRQLALGTCVVSLLAGLVTVAWEYQHVCGTIGGPPQFAQSLNVAARSGRPLSEVRREIGDAFRAKLRESHPPGGILGYVRWACGPGELELTLGDESEKVSISQSGYAWPIRTIGAFLLLAAGLWSALEALTSAAPVSNILAPGEEVMEEED